MYFFFSTKYFIIFGKVADQGHRGLGRTKDLILYTNNAQYKNKYINSHSANKHNWKNKKNCYRYHSSSILKKLESLLFSILNNLLFLHRKRFLSQATPCVPHCENQNHYCHTNYQQHKSCGSQTLYTFFFSNSDLFYRYIPDTMIPICQCVYEVHFSFSWERILFLKSACVNMMMLSTQIQVQIGDNIRLFYESASRGFKKTTFCVRFRRHVL